MDADLHVRECPVARECHCVRGTECLDARECRFWPHRSSLSILGQDCFVEMASHGRSGPSAWTSHRAHSPSRWTLEAITAHESDVAPSAKAEDLRVNQRRARGIARRPQAAREPGCSIYTGSAASKCDYLFRAGRSCC